MTAYEKIVNVLKNNSPMSAKEIAEETGVNYNTVRRELQWDTFSYSPIKTAEGFTTYTLA